MLLIIIIFSFYLSRIAKYSTSPKDQIKLQIIIFCAKHNRDCERAIRLELKTGKGRERGECDICI